jgi:hypothetical protein
MSGFSSQRQMIHIYADVLDNCGFILWTLSEGRRFVATFDTDTKQIWLSKCDSPTSFSSTQEFTDSLKQIGPLFEKNDSSAMLKLASSEEFLDMVVRCGGALPPTHRSAGIYVQPDPKGGQELPPSSFVWQAGNEISQALIWKKTVRNEQLTEAFFKQLESISWSRFCFPLGIEEVLEDAHGPYRMPMLTVNQPNEIIGWNDPHRQNDSFFRIEVVDDSDASILKRCLEAATGNAAAGSRIWVGVEGGVVFDGEKLIMVPAKSSEAYRLSRSQFNDWDNDDTRLLPSGFRTTEERISLQEEEIARRFVSDFNSQRQGVTGKPLAANLMSLLVRLARQFKTDDEKP